MSMSYQPGMSITVRKSGGHRMSESRENIKEEDEVFETTVLAVASEGLICESRISTLHEGREYDRKMSGSYAQWVEDACDAAGVPVSQRIVVVYLCEVERSVADVFENRKGLLEKPHATSCCSYLSDHHTDGTGTGDGDR